MKIAVFSDVHANLPALRAVYAHALTQNTDGIYCLGDLVNQNVWNNETVDFIRSHNIPCVRGNHDEGIGNNKSNFNFSFSMDDELKWGKEASVYTLPRTSAENKEWLTRLPIKLQLKVRTKHDELKITLTHGTPQSNTERIYRFYPSSQLLQILDEEDIDVLLIGNTHASFHKEIIKENNGQIFYKHIINPGSVGCPKDGSWHACYAVVSIDEQRDFFRESDAVEVQFFRLDYDINTVIKEIKKSGLPIYYGGRLLKY